LDFISSANWKRTNRNEVQTGFDLIGAAILGKSWDPVDNQVETTADAIDANAAAGGFRRPFFRCFAPRGPLD